MSSFTQIKALRPGRSVFNLNYEKKFDCDMGKLIPVACEEMVPGDTFKISNECVIRFQPLVAPILHEVNCYVHYFFVPTRLICEDWENFITGGVDGDDATILPRFGYDSDQLESAEAVGPHSLYDYFGFPVISKSGGGYTYPGEDTVEGTPAYNYRPLAFPWRGYAKIYNEYYRDETLQEEVDLDNVKVLNRNWTKDYFTSALPFPQRGQTLALPIVGSTSAVWDNSIDAISYFGTFSNSIGENKLYTSSLSSSPDASIKVNRSNQATSGYPYFSSIGKDRLNNNIVDLGQTSSVSINKLREAFQIQKWMERNARGGVRYQEFLLSHFGVSATDQRLQRPEYIGGSKSPILVSEVVQTAQGTSGSIGPATPIGRLAGKAITADRNYIGSYTASEFGYLYAIMSVMPKPSYQNGVAKQWLRSSRYDFYFPEFSHLGEQPVMEEEIYALPGDSTYTPTEGDPIGNATIFGYQARYNEMRMNQNMVCGNLRNTLDYWHCGRQFDTPPSLNSDFITCDASHDDLKRIFEVETEPGLIVNFANIITGIRPIPKFGEPGLIDHN